MMEQMTIYNTPINTNKTPKFNISFLNLKLIKEKEVKYEIERVIKEPEKVVQIAKNILKLHEEPEEVVCLITLDTKCQITGIFEVSRGSLSDCILHPREVFKRAILQNANSIILLHNHPSGDPLSIVH